MRKIKQKEILNDNDMIERMSTANICAVYYISKEYQTTSNMIDSCKDNVIDLLD